jgi:hypothetical protein
MTSTNQIICYSRGTNTFDNRPEQMTCSSFDEFEEVVLADRSPEKGLTFIGAPLQSGVHYRKPVKYPGEAHWRLGDNVLPRQWLAFDFDGFATVGSFKGLQEYLKRYRGFGYTTASHTDEAPRARAILYASRPMSRDECISVCGSIQKQIEDQLGVGAVVFDNSVYRGEQPVYTPVTNSDTFHFSGIAVDVEKHLQMVPAHFRDVKDTGLGAALSTGGYVSPERIEEGDRNSKVLAHIGYLRKCQVPEGLILGFILDFNNARCKPPLDADEVKGLVDRYEDQAHIPAADLEHDQWPDPEEIKDPLPPVPPFMPGLFPKKISDYVFDVAERMSCPPEFPAVAAMVALATAIGSRVHCKPYSKGLWFVPGGGWGMIVSPPSQIKSPPLSEMLRPLKLMDNDAADKFKLAEEQYKIDKGIYDNAVKQAIKDGNRTPGAVLPEEPKMTRYIVNDSTYEMLVKIADANPNGFLVFRDELAGWLHSLNKDNQKEARGLYLTGWSGTEGYATDRIGRGHVRADRLNISLIGTIQPNVLRSVVYDAVSGGLGDDGLVQRFQFAVYPDPVREFIKNDRHPNQAAMLSYENLIKKLITLDLAAIGASIAFDGTATVVFDEEAQAVFDEWREVLEERLRDPNSDETPAMLAHLGKYRSLLPKIALILHLSDGRVGAIGKKATIQAKAWTILLEAHARRIYHTASNQTLRSAATLANKIKADRLKDGFTRSDILVKEWANLRLASEVSSALTVLEDMKWLKLVNDTNTGGRPAQHFYINPKLTPKGKATG